MKRQKPVFLDIAVFKKLLNVKGRMLEKSNGKNISFSSVILALIEHYEKTVA